VKNLRGQKKLSRVKNVKKNNWIWKVFKTSVFTGSQHEKKDAEKT